MSSSTSTPAQIQNTCALPAAPRAVRYHAIGNPGDVLKFEPLDAASGAREPAEGEALVLMEMAVVHPSDLGMIGGTYGRLRPLPAIAGREGVGRIAKLGANATSATGAGGFSLAVGDRVRMPEDEGVWRDQIVARAADLIRIPADIDAEQIAQSFINPPTAWLLLREFVDLKKDDWVIQNAANSAVGECVIQLARALGLRTANLVRSPEKHEARLRALGADIVVADDPAALKTVQAQIAQIAAEDARAAGNARAGSVAPRLALNQIGGMSAITLARALGENGQLVTFGGMTGDAIRFPTREFIFKNIAMRGFWMDRWARASKQDGLQAVLNPIFERLRDGSLKMAVDSTHPLANYQDAIARAGGYGRNGKVLLRGPAGA